MTRRSLGLDGPLDLRLTLGPHLRGRGDPTMRLSSRAVLRATRTADGPATILIELRGRRVEAEAWGPGADRALDGLPGLLALDDDPGGFEPGRHPVVAAAARRLPHLRLGRSGSIFEALLPAILEQKITGGEAARAFRGLVHGYGEPAPGPVAASQRLRLQPAPETLAGLPTTPSIPWASSSDGPTSSGGRHATPAASTPWRSCRGRVSKLAPRLGRVSGRDRASGPGPPPR